MLRLRWREAHLACLWYLCGRFGRLQPSLRSSFSSSLHSLPIGAKFGSWFSVKPDYRVGRGKKTYSSDRVSTVFNKIFNYLPSECRYRTMSCCHFSWRWCDFPAVDRLTKLYFFSTSVFFRSMTQAYLPWQNVDQFVWLKLAWPLFWEKRLSFS